MTPDRIIGTAVLVTAGPLHWLYYLREGHSYAGIQRDDVPLLPDGAPRGDTKLPAHFPENNPWRYRVEGDTLRVHPSINISNNWWHNEGTWSVRFVAASGARHGDHVRQLVAANAGLPGLDAEELVRYLSE